MKSRWYFGALLAIVSLFVVNQQQIDVPNQQIVFQFNTAEVSTLEADKVIANVNKQLNSLGINSTRVVNDQNGTLKITYYSDKAISSIKTLLNKHQIINFDGVVFGDEYPFSSENEPKAFKLDVLEITQSKDAGSGFNDKYVIEAKYEYDRSSNPNVQLFSAYIPITKETLLLQSNQKITANNLVVKEVKSYNFPESRAGPTS